MKQISRGIDQGADAVFILMPYRGKYCLYEIAKNQGNGYYFYKYTQRAGRITILELADMAEGIFFKPDKSLLYSMAGNDFKCSEFTYYQFLSEIASGSAGGSVIDRLEANPETASFIEDMILDLKETTEDQVASGDIYEGDYKDFLNLTKDPSASAVDIFKKYDEIG